MVARAESFYRIAGEDINTVLGREVGPETHGTSSADVEASLGLHTQAGDEEAEVRDRKAVDAWRLVPLVGQGGRDRRPAPEKELRTGAPVTEVGKADHEVLGHPERLAHHEGRRPRLLQSLAENDVVKHAVRVVGEAFVNVAVVDGEAFAHSLVDFLLGDLHPRPANVLPVDQEL